MSEDLNHYVAKKSILRSVVEGVEVRALCGEMVLCEGQGKASMRGSECANVEYEICLDCEWIYGGLKEDRAEEPEPAHDKELA